MLRIILTCFLIFTISYSSHQEERKNKLIIAYSILKPWKSYENNKATGAYAQIIRELAKEVQLKTSFKVCKLTRCLALIKEGKADLIIGIKETKLRKDYITFLKTPYKKAERKVFYLNNTSEKQINNYEDLYKLNSIGIKIGARYFKKFNNDFSLNKKSVIDNKQNFKKLKMKLVDTVLIAQDQGEFLLSLMNLRNKFKKAKYFYEDNSYRYIGISKKSIHIKKIKDFESAMLKIKQTGLLREIMIDDYYKKYNIPINPFTYK